MATQQATTLQFIKKNLFLESGELHKLCGKHKSMKLHFQKKFIKRKEKKQREAAIFVIPAKPKEGVFAKVCMQHRAYPYFFCSACVPEAFALATSLFFFGPPFLDPVLDGAAQLCAPCVQYPLCGQNQRKWCAASSVIRSGSRYTAD